MSTVANTSTTCVATKRTPGSTIRSFFSMNRETSTSSTETLITTPLVPSTPGMLMLDDRLTTTVKPTPSVSQGKTNEQRKPQSKPPCAYTAGMLMFDGARTNVKRAQPLTKTKKIPPSTSHTKSAAKPQHSPLCPTTAGTLMFDGTRINSRRCSPKGQRQTGTVTPAKLASRTIQKSSTLVATERAKVNPFVNPSVAVKPAAPVFIRSSC
ncbi:hypothetical protein DFJ77DRAFT_446796 [Powellomyces hirtus]|nr:hypothetical protein DFJ77DRAFT_446796 [Powellomyces hirtus]